MQKELYKKILSYTNTPVYYLLFLLQFWQVIFTANSDITRDLTRDIEPNFEVLYGSIVVTWVYFFGMTLYSLKLKEYKVYYWFSIFFLLYTDL